MKAKGTILIGVPTFGTVDIRWAAARAGLMSPLGSMTLELALDQWELEVDQKRNMIASYAVNNGIPYVFFLGDDVVPPPNVLLQFLKRIEWGADIVTGVYWSKQNPPQPMIWKDYLKGPFMDWHVGDYFKVDMAGCDCLMVKTEVFRKLEPPWFSTEWRFVSLLSDVETSAERLGDCIRMGDLNGAANLVEALKIREARDYEKVDPASNPMGEELARFPAPSPPTGRRTEDFYFFAKCREAGIDVWCDTLMQCGHIDRKTRKLYGLPANWPQAIPGSAIPEKTGKLLAVIGAGQAADPLFQEYDVVKFDINPDAEPDVVADARALPEPSEKYDYVLAAHILEHLPMRDAPVALAEWCRVLKIGGKIEIRVPNLEVPCKRVVENDISDPYFMQMIYGLQCDPGQFHQNGFRPESLGNLLRQVGCLDEITVEGTQWQDQGVHTELTARAVKVKSTEPLALDTFYSDNEEPVREREFTTTETLAPEYSGA